MSNARLTEIRRLDFDLSDGQWLPLPNDWLRGKLPVPLSALARCMLQAMLSLPPERGWDDVRMWLAGTVMEGEEAVKTALKSLETAGYLERTKGRGPRGTWVHTWRVTADPIKNPLVKPEVGNRRRTNHGRTTTRY